MSAIAYLYQDPTWEAPLESYIWGWEVAQVYQDLDVKRPQLQTLLADVQKNPPTHLLLRRLEELGETLSEVTEVLKGLESQGVCVLVIEQGYQTGTASASPAPQLMSILSAVQLEQRSRQIRHGHAVNRLKGLPPPGKAPFGYRRGKDRYVIDRSVAPMVKDFFEHFLLYGSLRGAVRHLAQKHGKSISASTGQRWLTHPAYRGDLQFGSQEIIRDAHMPLISRTEAAQVDRLLRRNRRMAPRTASAPRSLAGLVTCAQCHSAMTITQVSVPRRAQTYLYLRPRQCPAQPKCRALPYQSVLDRVIAEICIQLPAAVAQWHPASNGLKPDLEQAIAAKQAVLRQLPELIEAQILDSATANLRAYTLKTEIARLTQKLAELPPINLKETAQAVSIPQFWADLSEPERRFFFREFIENIQLSRTERDWFVHLKLIF
ncbi:recombinase family protein [Synechococcales cyanobacterium C]|uniref:Recombinase family protein n=1 Tax=Petrachloros mirabilis ULC683 TaxID=2781853 RepID=A0A8K1ZW55_9CYAN|nr:recombinase family protein [Petrachloros mirabilis]NCJ05236.1 recombinase family protein [Petrachloros mirabilis ULC683]